MKFKIILIAVFILSIFQTPAFSQTVNEWEQDGIIIFQFKPELNISLPMTDRNNVDIKSTPFLLPFIEEYGVSKLKRLYPNIDDDKLLHTYQLEFTEIYKNRELIAALETIESIEYAEPKPLHRHFVSPNDTYYNISNQWHLFKIKAAQAWDISTGSASVIVAVCDNAIYTSHPDLINKMVAGYDVAENDNNPNPAGGNDGVHGTHVSGIVGAQTNNSTGVASIGWLTSVMPVKIGRDSDGALTAGYEGITWAANNGAHVINMSWGGGSSGSYGQNAINYAWGKGCIIIAAAGNDGEETMFYPAAYNNVVSVASTTSTDAKSYFSQYGTWIDISSPGSDIRSTVPNSSYQSLQGTSMASPLVAGLVGLMISVNPSLPQADVINCLLSTADNINAQNSSYIGKLGSGRINAYAAMQCMQATAVSNDAGITSINQPSGTVCSSSIAPVVVLKNFGMNNLTAVTIRYQIDAGSIQNYSWTGNLATGQTTVVTLPVISPASGGHAFKTYTYNPNGQVDENNANDQSQSSFTIFSAGVTLPFTENFESGVFTTNNWTILNPDGQTTWNIVNVAGTSPGSKAASLNFYNYSNTGQRDGMVTPPLNLAGYSSATLDFKHAYVRYSSSSTDSLIIHLSTDCGTTYQRVLALGEDGTGNFATSGRSTTAFTPTVTNNWCSGTIGVACQTIDLTPFVGNTNVVVKFESYNNNGNNLFIDNINITGVALTTAPTVNFTSSASSICEGQSITFTDQSSPAVMSREWTFEGGTPGTSTNASQMVTYNNAGAWDVQLKATNGFGTSTQNYPNYITVNASPATQSIVQNENTLSVTLQAGQTVQWYRNGNMIAGATSTTYVVLQVGNYKARIFSPEGCSVFTNEILITPVGIEEYDFETNTLTLFPNPAEDIIYVYLATPVMKNTIINITDLAGKTVASYTVQAGDQKIQMNVALLAQGTYLVHLCGKIYSNTERLLIAR